jgi:hypothetical protein
MNALLHNNTGFRNDALGTPSPNGQVVEPEPEMTAY